MKSFSVLPLGKCKIIKMLWKQKHLHSLGSEKYVSLFKFGLRSFFLILGTVIYIPVWNVFV